MRRSRALLARLIPVAMLASLLALVGGSPANADPIPTTNWTPVSVGSALPGASDVMTDANGGVTVGCQQASSSTLFQTFDGIGTKVQDQTIPSGYSGSFCPGSSGNATVGKDGTVYVAMSSGSSQYIQAWKNNSLVWTYTIPCGAYGFPWSMTMGADGNLYAVISQGSGSCYGWQLIGVTPTAQSGTSPAAPQQVMNQPIYAGSVYGGGLAAYNNGLVLYTNGGIQYAPYTGTWPDVITPSGTLLRTQVGTVSRWFEASPAGRVFVVNKAPTGQVQTCSDQGNRAGGITAIDPDGTMTTSTLGACTTVHEIHPMPNGGAMLRYAYSDSSTGWSDEERISAGSWHQTIGLPDSPGAVVTSVDLNGDIVVRVNAAVAHQVSGSTYRFPQIAVSVFSGVTGETISSAQFALRGDSTTTSGPSYMWTSGGDLAMAKNTVYVAAYQCATLNSGCNMSNTKLYAFTVPGVQMDYPRGAILGAGAASQNYVAMGDSFSAGQGVPPFTDSSGCNRSTQAYSYLLAQSVVRPLTLQSFIACSGATTQDVQLGGITGANQPKQVNALSTTTKLVTITIGGNDIGFGPLAQECVQSPDCTTSAEYSNAEYDLTNTLPTALDQTYAAIAAKLGPYARVLVVGYPMMIPDPAINTLPNCPYLSHDEKVAARNVISQLNQAVQAAVSRAGSPFEYVDPNTAQSPFVGHELCVDGGYYNGVDVAHPEYSLHPNAMGQDAFRWVIEAYLG